MPREKIVKLSFFVSLGKSGKLTLGRTTLLGPAPAARPATPCIAAASSAVPGDFPCDHQLGTAEGVDFELLVPLEEVMVVIRGLKASETEGGCTTNIGVYRLSEENYCIRTGFAVFVLTSLRNRRKYFIGRKVLF